MTDPAQECARDLRAELRWNGTERRRHPRRATDLLEGAATESTATRPRLVFLLGRLLARCGAPAPAWLAPAQPVLTRCEARRARLPGIVRRLETLLGELDDISAWREAAEVCSALERLKAEIAEEDSNESRERWTF